MKKNILLALIVAFAFVIRVVLLNQFPIGMTHDELNYIFTAKSLFLTHSFPPGTAPAILPTQMINFTVTVAEVPSIILAFLIGGVPMSLFSGRMVGAIFSTLSAVAIYLLVFEISNKRTTALISAALMAINPWSFLMGRTVFEVNFFVAFFLWGFVILLKNKGWKVFFAIPFYLLGFFSYTGGQISFLVFILATLVYRFYAYGRDKKFKRVYLSIAGIFIALFLSYLFLATRNQTFIARGKELYLPDNPGISKIVDQVRKLSVPNPLSNIFLNKATVYMNGFVDKYLNTFSVNNLFLKGEARAAFSYQEHGTFYLLDFVFILVGFAFLLKTNKKAWLLFIGILGGVAVTSGLSTVESSYSQRVGLIYPFLIMLSGIGISGTLSLVAKRNMKIVMATALSLAYLISFANLMYIYFYRFPVYASDGWFFQDRELASYIQKTKKVDPNAKIYVFTGEPKIIFEEYLFYSNSYNKNTATRINGGMAQQLYQINDVYFSDQCPDSFPTSENVSIFDSAINCSKIVYPKNYVRITRLRDVFEHYLIFNDRLCNDNLSHFVAQSAFANFEIEDESSQQFCTNWITQK